MNPSCRLCGESTTEIFSKLQLQKYLVKYCRCGSCASLQTEDPYWLAEAYSGLNFAKDTGMVARTLFTAELISLLALEEGFHQEDKVLDFGGGTGLLTRMLRDVGLNAFWCDKYAQNIFSIGFEQTLETTYKPKLITAFEVFEHLPRPQDEIARLLEKEPDYLLFSTKLYQDQGLSWWYLLEDGQHVQFYSKKGLEKLATHFGYHFSTEGSSYHCFSKQPQKGNFLKKLCRKVKPTRVEQRARKKWPSRTEADHHLIKASLSS